MARPRKADRDKRKLVGARFGPAQMTLLQDASLKSDRSLGAEVEARVVATLGLDERGVALVSEIARHVVSVERITGKRWHRDLKTWAAVKEILSRGAIEQFNPDQWQDDPAASAAYDQFAELSDERQVIVADLRNIGLPVTEDPRSQSSILRTGLLALASADGGRGMLRKALEELSTKEASVNQPDVSRYSAKMHRLLELDELVPTAEKEWLALIDPYFEAEGDGSVLAKRALQKHAEHQRDAGEAYNPIDLWGLWR